jgi:hypothetical protein
MSGVSRGERWSARNQSPKTFESPRIIEIPVIGFLDQLHQLDSTAAEKIAVQVSAEDGGTARIGIRYHKNGAVFWIDKDTVLTFDGPRHPFWRPFYLKGEGTSDNMKLVFWMSGTQDGPVI